MNISDAMKQPVDHSPFYVWYVLSDDWNKAQRKLTWDNMQSCWVVTEHVKWHRDETVYSGDDEHEAVKYLLGKENDTFTDS